MFNRPQRERVLPICVALVFGLTIGCSDRSDSVTRSTKEADNSAASNPKESTSEDVRDAAELHASSAQFKPPFPDRQELFLPPEQQETVKPQAARKDSSVKVKGFANADGMHALLVIDGRLTAMRVGESRGGVEVLSVKPPRVVLRQDGQSWTESLSSGARSGEDEERAAGQHNPQNR